MSLRTLHREAHTARSLVDVVRGRLVALSRSADTPDLDARLLVGHALRLDATLDVHSVAELLAIE